MSEFKNNLRRGDTVLEASSKRPGVVAQSPWSKLRAVTVKFQGELSPRRCDVLDLRLVVDGKAEDVAPVEGTPPELTGRRVVRSEGTSLTDPVAVLKAQKAKLAAKMVSLNAEFKATRELADRTDKAIAALEAVA